MPNSKDSSVQVAVIVAGLLAVVGGAWLFLNSGTDEAIETTQVATRVAPQPVQQQEPETIPVDTALQMAEMAFQSGQLAGEEEGSALDFYRQVLDQDPANTRAKAGLQLIATQLVDEANDLMAKGNYEQVVQRLKSLNKIEAGSDAVLALQQSLVDKAASMFESMDAAIGSGELETAEELARSLRVIPDADSGRINAAMVTIAQTRKEREIAAAEAKEREAELARSAAEAAELPTTEAVAFNSSKRMTDDLDQSTTGLSIESIDPAIDGATTSFEPQLIDPAEQVRAQIEELLASAASKVEDKRFVAPSGDNAVELFNQVLALESTNADAKRGLRSIVQQLTSQAYESAEEGDIEAAREALDQAEGVGIAEALVTQARSDVRTAWLAAESQKVISLKGFEVEKSVPPKYPKRAMTRSIEGWVKIEFTVAEDGKTRDLKVVESSQRLAKQFSSSALKAVEQWRFKPRVLDGEVIAQRSETLVQFKLAEE
ncbi:MAG: energy transducer TonB [Pseudomonadota bacterium]